MMKNMKTKLVLKRTGQDGDNRSMRTANGNEAAENGGDLANRDRMTGNGSIEEGRDRGMNQSPFGRQNGILHEDRINNKAKMKKASGRDKNRLFPLDAPTHQCREQKSYEDHRQWQ